MVLKVLDRRFDWLRRAGRELAEFGAPAIDLFRAAVYWDEASERLAELILDQYSTDEADILFERVSAFDVAFLAVALAAQERDEGWYEVAAAKLIARYDRMLTRVRESRSLPNVRLSLPSGFASYSDADPGL